MFDFIRLWLPELHGQWGQHIDDLFVLTTVMTVVAFAAVCGLMLYCVIAFRERPGHRARYFHGDSRLHLLITAVLSALVFVGMDYQLESRGRRAVEAYKAGFTEADKGLRLQVRGQQFKWYVRYAGPDGDFGTPDDFVTTDLVVPVDTDVAVQLQSKDVIHSFYLPYHRLKQDAVPGLTTTTWFRATHLSWHNATDEQRKAAGNVPKTWELGCAELCGSGHTNMRNPMLVMEPDEFDRWLQARYAEDIEYDMTLGEEEVDGKYPNWGWSWEPRGWMAKSPDFEPLPDGQGPAEAGHEQEDH